MKLVIFDLDGVLFESRDMHFVTLNRALMYNGYPPISAEAHKNEYNGLPTWKKLSKLGIGGKEAGEVNDLKQTYTQNWINANVTMDPGLIRLFDDLLEAGYIIAVCSNARGDTTHNALNRLGLLDKVHTYVSPGGNLRPKPAPDMFFHCIGRVGSTPADTLIVEDSAVGLEAAGQTGSAILPVTGPHDVVPMVRKVCKV